MADKEKDKEPNFFQAWADGFERGKQRFMAHMGKGGGPAIEPPKAKPKKATKPAVKAAPAKQQAVQRMKPVEARPAASQPAVMQIASAPGQEVSPIYEPEAYKGFWDDYYAGKQNQADGVTTAGPRYRDPYSAIASKTDEWLQTRGLSNDKVLDYAANRAPALANTEYMAPGEPDPTLSADELNDLRANTDWDEWYDKQGSSRWGY